uniref:V-type proton ATPase subunit S1/VOA1 transmembrane domain-containing protein n=1 Tax=Setaria digitata TaxID=48799 RepID=A0A915PTZ5_9BILA
MWQPSCLAFLIAWFHYCIAFDAILFSTSQLKRKTVEDLITSSKVLAIGVRDFTLPGFSVYAQAYSAQNSDGPFAFMMRMFPYRKAFPMENPLMVTNADSNHKSASGVDYVRFDTLRDLHKILANDGNFKGYQTIIISSQDAFEEEMTRRKRVSSDVTFDEEPSSNGVPELRKQKQTASRQRLSGADSHVMPVVLPPPNPSQKNMKCLLYMEAFDIIIPNSGFLNVGSEGKNKYLYNPDYYKCDISNGKNDVRLDFVRSRDGYWYLNGTTLKNNFKITAKNVGQDLTVSTGTAVNRVDIGAVFNQNFACFQTDAVTLGLTESTARFGYYTTDCIGTFSAGTWMGIIISVVFISILLFGYLMLQSIQTMDRFDDLKQKQIVINFKE